MPMHPPVNFDSVILDAMLSDWLRTLGEFSVDAVVVLGPDPFAEPDQRLVLALHPPRLIEAARALAESTDFGASWRDSNAPLVAWQHLSKSALETQGRWRSLWLGHGYLSVVRVEFPLPAGRAFECFMFSPRECHDRSNAAALEWSGVNLWPLLRRTLVDAQGVLSPRERECLSLAFSGLTARQSAEHLACRERTVNYHLANAMAKLRVDNKLAAIQRACWIGAL